MSLVLFCTVSGIDKVIIISESIMHFLIWPTGESSQIDFKKKKKSFLGACLSMSFGWHNGWLKLRPGFQWVGGDAQLYFKQVFL